MACLDKGKMTGQTLPIWLLQAAEVSSLAGKGMYLKTEAVKAHPLIIVDNLVLSLMLQEVYERLQVRLIGHHYAQHLYAGLCIYDLLPWLLQHT